MKIVLLSFILCNSAIFGALLHPPDGSVLNYVHVKFRWEKINGANQYEFELSNMSDFSSSLNLIKTNELYYIEKNSINWQSNYFWRVRSLNSAWLYGEFSTGSPSYIFASNKVSQVEILTNNTSSNGVTIFGLITPFYSSAIDMNGKEIWNSGGVDTYMFSSVDLNNFIFLGTANLPPNYKGELGIEFSIEDGIIWSQPTFGDQVDFLQHELIKLSNGNYMGFAITHKEHFIPNSDNYPIFDSDFNFGFEKQLPPECGNLTNCPYTWKSERIVEWDKNGNEVWSWDPFDHFDLDDFDFIEGFWEFAFSHKDPYDWTHFNALVYDENEDMIYVSAKNLSRITKINKNSGEIVWNIGRRWLGSKNNHNLIQPSMDSLRFSGQHGLQLLENNNIVILDNGIASGTNDGTLIDKSRAMELKVNEINDELTLEIVWSYTLPVDLYGIISGNVQKLNNGNYLITTVGSTINIGAHSLEVNQSGEIVWDCQYNVGTPQGGIYRAMRIPGLYEIDFNSLSITNINLPQFIKLGPVYPNPFNPIINIEYSLFEGKYVIFNIYNVRGEIIDNINIGYKQSGNYSTSWDGTDFAAGIYFLLLEDDAKSLIKKIILLK